MRCRVTPKVCYFFTVSFTPHDTFMCPPPETLGVTTTNSTAAYSYSNDYLILCKKRNPNLSHNSRQFKLRIQLGSAYQFGGLSKGYQQFGKFSSFSYPNQALFSNYSMNYSSGGRLWNENHRYKTREKSYTNGESEELTCGLRSQSVNLHFEDEKVGMSLRREKYNVEEFQTKLKEHFQTIIVSIAFSFTPASFAVAIVKVYGNQVFYWVTITNTQYFALLLLKNSLSFADSFPFLAISFPWLEGTFVALAPRFDVSRGQKSRYFKIALLGYAVGVVLTIVVMNWFQGIARPERLHHIALVSTGNNTSNPISRLVTASYGVAIWDSAPGVYGHPGMSLHYVCLFHLSSDFLACNQPKEIQPL
ncbi:hypothetical protein L2E82_15314 [Cichorium intybus]|uniref:Uncharacterized protein n=1 Tax=Cichorium intybus TaxID=13427 RepID=A0ACB9F227_CICIN|nr:hypothetical protein L2E82_15314 [Cichorium intybus]